MNKTAVQKHNEVCLLLDYYGSLLTERRQQILRLYYEEDMSLSEIAELLQITRQAVHDNMQQGISQLEEYETKLRSIERDTLLIDQIQNLLENDLYSDPQKVKKELIRLQNIIL